MRTLVFIGLLWLAAGGQAAERSKVTNLVPIPLNVETIEKLIPALIKVESGGNDRAVGDNGEAFGCLQIHQAVITDVKKFTGQPWQHTDAFDRRKSIVIFKSYIAYYAQKKLIGREPTLEDAARIWNGGPGGYGKAATKKYWEKVQKEMK